MYGPLNAVGKSIMEDLLRLRTGATTIYPIYCRMDSVMIPQTCFIEDTH